MSDVSSQIDINSVIKETIRRMNAAHVKSKLLEMDDTEVIKCCKLLLDPKLTRNAAAPIISDILFKATGETCAHTSVYRFESAFNGRYRNAYKDEESRLRREELKENVEGAEGHTAHARLTLIKMVTDQLQNAESGLDPKEMTALSRILRDSEQTTHAYQKLEMENEKNKLELKLLQQKVQGLPAKLKQALQRVQALEETQAKGKKIKTEHLGQIKGILIDLSKEIGSEAAA